VKKKEKIRRDVAFHIAQVSAQVSLDHVFVNVLWGLVPSRKCLLPVHGCVYTTDRKQFCVSTAFNDSAVTQHVDAVYVLDTCKSMRNSYTGPPFAGGLNSIPNVLF